MNRILRYLLSIALMRKLHTRQAHQRIHLWAMILALALPPLTGHGQHATFDVVPLGIRGGGEESNLSSYAISAEGQNAYVCLDAGTLRSGIEAAIRNKVWQGDATSILRNQIKGYAISHPHLDHVSGLILNSPDDSAKPIYGTTACLSVIRDKYFSWQSWANFANEGEKPTLNKYTYKYLTPGVNIPLEGTSLSMTPYLLSHVNPYSSSAFLIHHNDNAILYFGDTGADRIEKSDKLSIIWNTIAPMIREKKLKAMFIEVSFANEQADDLLFGHLTPKLLMEELAELAALLPAGSLRDFPVIVTHMKPGNDRIEKIISQLRAGNTAGVKLVFPEQGKKIRL